MVNTVAHSYRAYLAMEETEAKIVAPDRIRFEVQDEEAALGASSNHRRHDLGATSKRPALGRSATAISEDSVHLRPGSSQRGSMTIEPSAGLPIQYRTL